MSEQIGTIDALKAENAALTTRVAELESAKPIRDYEMEQSLAAQRDEAEAHVRKLAAYIAMMKVDPYKLKGSPEFVAFVAAKLEYNRFYNAMTEGAESGHAKIADLTAQLATAKATVEEYSDLADKNGKAVVDGWEREKALTAALAEAKRELASFEATIRNGVEQVAPVRAWKDAIARAEAAEKERDDYRQGAQVEANAADEARAQVAALHELIVQFETHITAIAASVGACCGGVDGPVSDPNSTAGAIIAKVAALKDRLAKVEGAAKEVSDRFHDYYPATQDGKTSMRVEALRTLRETLTPAPSAPEPKI